jgi:hypothetical protein
MNTLRGCFASLRKPRHPARIVGETLTTHAGKMPATRGYSDAIGPRASIV